MQTKAKYKTKQSYWDHLWDIQPFLDQIDPRDKRLKNNINRQFHVYFKRVFSDMPTKGRAMLEIGCARSVWLPYFAKTFGFTVNGIDYSEVGCAQARQILLNRNVEGEVLCGDFFSPPGFMLSKYDVVVSFGVVEHFEDTSKCISAIAKFIKPGGFLITVIPNINGLIGFLQKNLDENVYKMHVPLSPSCLAEACKTSGLIVVDNGYFIFTHFGILNLSTIVPGSAERVFKNAICRILVYFSAFIWVIEDVIGPLRPNKLVSPYVNCVAQKVL